MPINTVYASTYMSLLQLPRSLVPGMFGRLLTLAGARPVAVVPLLGA
jgi:hypothetical protein